MQKQLEKGFQKHNSDYLKIKKEFLPTIPASKIRYKLSTIQYGNANIFTAKERLYLAESVLHDRPGITFELVNELKHSYAATISLRALYIKWCRNQLQYGKTMNEAVTLLKEKIGLGVKRNELEKDLVRNIENQMILLIKKYGFDAIKIHDELGTSIQEIRAYLRKFHSSVKPQLKAYENELLFVRLLMETTLERVPKPDNISMTKYRRYMDMRSKTDQLLSVANELESKIAACSENIRKRGGWSPIPHFKKLALARKLFENDLESILKFFDNEFSLEFIKEKIKRQDELLIYEELFVKETQKEKPDWRKLSIEIGDSKWLSTRKAAWNKIKKKQNELIENTKIS